MGRHARGAARSRAPVATVGLGVLVVVIVAVGSWLGSRAETVTGTVAASAVVATSPACSAGSGQTVVDVLTPVDSPSGGNLVRATLDACGYQEGQQLAVRYHPGNPTEVGLVDPAAASTATGALLPLGLALAGLLAVCAALAVYADGRRRPSAVRHAAGAREPADARSATDLPEAGDTQTHARRADDEASPVPDGAIAIAPDGTVMLPVRPAVAGRHAASSPEGATPTTATPTTPARDLLPADPRSMQFPDHNGHGPFTASQARATSVGENPPFDERSDPFDGSPAILQRDARWTPETGVDRPGISTVDLIFPYSSTLAASLHDELFTHRTVSG